MAKRLGQLVIADADVAGRTVHVVLDTGSEVSIGNGALATWLGRTQADDGARFTLVSVTGGKVAARAMSMPALRLGTVRLRGMQIAIADAHIFRQLGLDNRPALLLGMDALRSFDRVSIDLAKGRVSLTLPGKDVTDQPSRLAFKG